MGETNSDIEHTIKYSIAERKYRINDIILPREFIGLTSPIAGIVFSRAFDSKNYFSALIAARQDFVLDPLVTSIILGEALYSLSKISKHDEDNALVDYDLEDMISSAFEYIRDKLTYAFQSLPK